MPETDTAVMEQGTAFEAQAAEATQEAVETAPDQSAEAVQAETTETAEAPEATETAAQPDLRELIKSLSEDDLRELPEVKSILARDGESMRQRTERETATKLAQQREEYVVTGKVFEDLQGLLVNAPLDDKGRPAIDQTKFEEITGALTAHSASSTVGVFANVLNELTGPEFSFTDDEKALVEAAHTRWLQNPRDPSPLIRAWLKPYARSEAAANESAIRKDERAKARADFIAEQKAQQAKQATDQRKEQPGATAVNGGRAPVKYESQRQIDRLHANDQISTDEYRALRANGTYAGLPR